LFGIVLAILLRNRKASKLNEFRDLIKLSKIDHVCGMCKKQLREHGIEELREHVNKEGFL